MYKTLADVYAAILKGDLKKEEHSIMWDAGDVTVYDQNGDEVFEGYEGDALDFVALVLGIKREYP